MRFLESKIILFYLAIQPPIKTFREIFARPMATGLFGGVSINDK